MGMLIPEILENHSGRCEDCGLILGSGVRVWLPDQTQPNIPSLLIRVYLENSEKFISFHVGPDFTRCFLGTHGSLDRAPIKGLLAMN